MNKDFMPMEIAPTFDAIPPTLRDIPHWLCWKKQILSDDPKPKKVPMSPKDGRLVRAAVNKPENWLSFVDAVSWYQRGLCSGIGFALSDDNGVCCIDIDDCRDADGNLNQTARDVLTLCKNSWTEKSQSGKGIHIFLIDKDFHGEVGRKKDNVGVEVYCRDRYIAITGVRVETSSDTILEVSGACRAVIAKFIDAAPADVTLFDSNRKTFSDLPAADKPARRGINLIAMGWNDVEAKMPDGSENVDFADTDFADLEDELPADVASTTEGSTTTEGQNTVSAFFDSLDADERRAVDYFRSDKCKRRDPNMFDLFAGGDVQKYCQRVGKSPNNSVADEDLMLKILFYVGGTGTEKQIKSRVLKVYGKSALAKRDKWQSRDDYKFRTLEAAFRHWTENGRRALKSKAEPADVDKNFKDLRGNADVAPAFFDVLFEGLKPIDISAGAILNVADADAKPALETLFVERDFTQFVLQTAPADKADVPTEGSTTTADAASLTYSTPFGDYNISVEQVMRSLQWLIGRLFLYFDDTADLKKFIVERLTAADAPGAIKILQEGNFFQTAVDTCTEIFAFNKKFRFDERFRQALIKFARHSADVFQSLVRFDYRRLENFLQTDLTHVACAELLVDVQRDFLRFDTTQATWYVWNKNHWQAVKVKSMASLFDLWTPLARKARVFADFDRFKKYCDRDDFAINNPDARKDKKTPAYEKYRRLVEAAKHATAKCHETAALENSRAIEYFFEQASGLPEIKIQTSDLDRNKFLFNCANGTLDLEHMEFYPARREDLITVSTPTEYNPSAKSDAWLNFITSAIPDADLRDWFQRFFGYTLTADTKERFIAFIYGVGGSGKTTGLNAIKETMGDYAKVFSVDMITENTKQKDGNEPDPALAALRSCRLARSSETKRNRRLDEATMKRLVGRDPLTARELHKPPFEFYPCFKMVIDGNFELAITDTNDVSLRDRIRIIPFNNRPTPDKLDTTLADKLSTPESLSGILNWLIEGWQKYRQRGLRDVPTVMGDALNRFYAANDAIADFLEEHDYRKDEYGGLVAVMDVFHAYTDWQRRTPRTPIFNRKDFVQTILQSLENDGITLTKKDNKQFFKGMWLTFPLKDKESPF